MKYDSQISELKNLLPNSKNILIALPSGADIDKYAASLGLFLSLKQAGKEVSIVSDDAVKVAQSHLFGVDQIKNILPQTGSSNFTITLEGVPSVNGTVPSLEKMDYVAENNNLNLIFYTVPGQTFNPSNIVPKYPTQNAGFDLIFTVGATSLVNLGQIYSQNTQVFSGAHLVNIDNQNSNSNFGQTNVVDQNASISEIMTDLIPTLGLQIDADMASNLLAGIFEATANLTNQKVTPDTYLAVGNNMKFGGKKPVERVASSQPTLDLNSFIPGGNNPSVAASQTNPVTPQMDFTMPPVIPTQPSPVINMSNTPSPEDQPIAETASTPEPGWLTPKVFKGSSIG